MNFKNITIVTHIESHIQDGIVQLKFKSKVESHHFARPYTSSMSEKILSKTTSKHQFTCMRRHIDPEGVFVVTRITLTGYRSLLPPKRLYQH